MKNQIIKTIILLLAFTFQARAQDNLQNNQDIDKIVKQINDSLPIGWLTKTDSTSPDEIIIQSVIIDLSGSMLSNDPLVLKGHCEIFILLLPRISPDSIMAVRKRNKELKENLPPQNSKDNLKDWYTQNAGTLKIIDSEPTHYDNKHSYRIKCIRLPKNENDLAEYNKIMSIINSMFTKYPD